MTWKKTRQAKIEVNPFTNEKSYVAVKRNFGRYTDLNGSKYFWRVRSGLEDAFIDASHDDDARWLAKVIDNLTIYNAINYAEYWQ